ncbi:D-alanine--D-alanine ligase [Telmatospirillum siberiense]|uniref:D-alanine--D-alanine ligase n=1 Tax=Telmatospirillum siberiense TaxID=382514 RepID=A0A2N3PQL5_9PROT|nr:D-alanine--D-alanine ligase [Telmatospirillum siberiense]PKU22691.1 D-alanine--D-alanine ligase [Telmatospirillum siberiense]
MSKRVVVLMGGFSVEREVSLNSGAAVAGALEKAGYAVATIDVRRDLRTLVAGLEATKPWVVFNALHGRFGEDGSIQGILDIMKIPYTHSGLRASALAMDKPTAKSIFTAAGIPVPEGRIVRKDDVLAGDVLPRPYVLKPLNEGSSVGVHIVREGENGNPLAGEDWPFGDFVLAERFIPGRELTVGVMGDKALAVTEITSERGFYDYTAKYAAGGSLHLIPAPVPPEIQQAAMEIAVKGHQALGCRGVSRADLRYDDTEPGQPGKLYMLEINTQPGMTSTSLVPEQAAHAGIGFADLVTWMVENAQCDG